MYGMEYEKIWSLYEDYDDGIDDDWNVADMLCEASEASSVYVAPVEITKNQFKDKFGDSGASYLEQIGCERIVVNGNQVKFELREPYTYPVGQGPIKDARLSKEITFDFSINGDEISLKNIGGLKLNPYIGPKFGCPDVKISPKGIDLGAAIPNIPAEGLFDSLREVIIRL